MNNSEFIPSLYNEELKNLGFEDNSDGTWDCWKLKYNENFDVCVNRHKHGNIEHISPKTKLFLINEGDDICLIEGCSLSQLKNFIENLKNEFK